MSQKNWDYVNTKPGATVSANEGRRIGAQTARRLAPDILSADMSRRAEKVAAVTNASPQVPRVTRAQPLLLWAPRSAPDGPAGPTWGKLRVDESAPAAPPGTFGGRAVRLVTTGLGHMSDVANESASPSRRRRPR